MIPNSIKYIVVGAVCARLLLLAGILTHSGTEGVFLPDSRGFYQTAVNITAGHGFSRDVTAPFLPSAHFPPLYPLLIAGSLTLTGSILPLIILQIVLSSFIPLIIWRIGTLFTERRAPPLIAATLSAFEPLMMLWSVVLLTDVLATFLLLAAVLFFCQFLTSRAIRHTALSGLVLGAAALTRPDGQFLFLIATAYFLSALLYTLAKKTKEVSLWHAGNPIIISGILFIISFYLATSPWLIRNWIQFKTTNVATTGLRNVYVTLAPAVMSLKTGRTYDEETNILITRFSETYHVEKKEMYENPAYGNLLVKEGLAILFKNPKETTEVFLININAFFTQDLYTTYLRHFGVIPRFPFDFSPSVVLLKEGPIVLWHMIGDQMGLYAIIPILGRLLWMGFTILGLFGAYSALRNQKERAIGFALLFVIAYFAASSMAAGFSDYGRHRYPANAFIFLFAGYGIAIVADKMKRKQEKLSENITPFSRAR